MESIIGDATNPIKTKQPVRVIMHVCNNKGGWGRGFVKAVSRRWKQPEKKYRSIKEYVLGTVQLVNVGEGIVVANMIAQDTYGRHCKKRRCIDYDALSKCLRILALELDPQKHSIHFPKIGAGLGGGKWADIADIIETELKGFSLVLYEMS